MDREIEKALNIIQDGGLVVFPTETAYGIATDATDAEAVEKVFEAKQRPRDKGLTVIVDSLEQVETYAELSDTERKIVKEFMPGPVTLVAEKKERVPDNLNEDFAFRISSSEVAERLSSVGPITATSANISGKDTSYSIDDVSRELLDRADYVLDVGQLDSGPTSTIAEVQDGQVFIHREGPISQEELEAVINDVDIHG